MRYTVCKDYTFDSMGYSVKSNGEKIAEFWVRKYAVFFRDELIRHDFESRKQIIKNRKTVKG